jgi:hypothetical protein
LHQLLFFQQYFVHIPRNNKEQNIVENNIVENEEENTIDLLNDFLQNNYNTEITTTVYTNEKSTIRFDDNNQYQTNNEILYYQIIKRLMKNNTIVGLILSKRYDTIVCLILSKIYDTIMITLKSHVPSGPYGCIVNIKKCIYK